MSLATPEGTARFASRARDAGTVDASAFSAGPRGTSASSVGIGTYLGESDDATDDLYARSIARALERGVNVVDTALNYRFQRSERVVGRVLAEAFARGTLARDEVVVGSKVGFVPYDSVYPARPAAYVADTFFATGVFQAGEIVGGHHVLSGAFVRWGLARSLGNLGLAALDVYYLHNPETQLSEVPASTFASRLRDAVVALEEGCAAGKIGCWGLATWDGLRLMPGSPGHLSLEQAHAIARDVAGEYHHFGAIELPYNLAMPQALTRATQVVAGQAVTILEAAARLGLTVWTSATLHEARLARGLPAAFGAALPGTTTDAARAIQFVRSTPGVSTALVGTTRLEHVDADTEVLRVPRLSPDERARARQALARR